MSGESAPSGMSTQAAQRRPQPVQWDLVFFKIEEIIFPVSPHRLIESSEVFAGMFDLPTGEDQRVEGRDKEHPIVLEGYLASDFSALLKVLYPTLRDLISGTCKLEKEEWVGILNLSTRWQMKEVREHAIDNLSKISLSATEKVNLARSHKVAKWLTEGLTEIVTENPIRPFEELKSLGLETTSRLLWIRDQTSSTLVKGLQITLGGLGCGQSSCKAAIFTSPVNCRSCNQQLLVDEPDAIFLCGCSVQIIDTGTSGPGIQRSQVVLDLRNLRCKHCGNYPLTCTTYSCPSCGSVVGYSGFRLLSPGFGAKCASDVTVGEVFKEEIASYESWDH